MLLLLAGTAEARAAATLLAEAGVPVLASLAGATRQPEPMPVETRIGGFGGAAGFEAELDRRQITAILDATHPFAASISARTALIAARRGLPYMRLSRPEWTPGPGDDWTMLDDARQAPQVVPPGSTVFLATGPKSLGQFAGLRGRRLICRRIDPPEGPFPFAGGEYLVGRPPFTVAGERALFDRCGVDWLIVKNAGGDAGRPKLIAAAELGIAVAMIRRPPPPDAPTVQTAEAAAAWARGLPW